MAADGIRDARVLTALSQRRADIVEAVFALRDRKAPVTRTDIDQLANGFLHLMAAAAAGDLALRDEYLRTVIPGLRAAGISFATTLEAMTRVSIAVVTCMPREHHAWLADFCGDYTARLVTAWQGEGRG